MHFGLSVLCPDFAPFVTVNFGIRVETRLDFEGLFNSILAMIRDRRKRRHLSLRRRVTGTRERPRLCVSRSNRQVMATLVDDTQGRVLSTVTSLLSAVQEKKLKRTEASKEVGRLIAARARELGVVQVVFDRGGYRYHGRVKSVADGAREGGLRF